MADAARDIGGVTLDLHAPAAPVAGLAASHVGVDGLAVELEARRDALDDAGQARAVRLARRDELQRHSAPESTGESRALLDGHARPERRDARLVASGPTHELLVARRGGDGRRAGALQDALARHVAVLEHAAVSACLGA